MNRRKNLELPERRRGIGPGLWHAAKCAGLALAGFGYLVVLIALLHLVADLLGLSS